MKLSDLQASERLQLEPASALLATAGGYVLCSKWCSKGRVQER
jgi:hypothetical protein